MDLLAAELDVEIHLYDPPTSEGVSKRTKLLTMNAFISSVRGGMDSSSGKGPVKVGAMPDPSAHVARCIGRGLFLLNGNGTAVPEKQTREVGCRSRHITAHATQSIVHFLFFCKNLLSSREFSGRVQGA